MTKEMPDHIHAAYLKAVEADSVVRKRKAELDAIHRLAGHLVVQSALAGVALHAEDPAASDVIARFVKCSHALNLAKAEQADAWHDYRLLTDH